jgi:hypothetical protein
MLGARVLLGVGVMLGVRVWVGSRVGVPVRDGVRVLEGVRVRVTNRVRVGVALLSSVAVRVGVDVSVAVASIGAVPSTVAVFVAVWIGVRVAVPWPGVAVAPMTMVSVGDAGDDVGRTPVRVGVCVAPAPVVVGDGVSDTCGQPFSARPTAPTSSSTVTRRSRLASTEGHRSNMAAPVAILVAVTSSLTRMTESSLQSPAQTLEPVARPARPAAGRSGRCATARCAVVESPATHASMTAIDRILNRQL